MVLLPSSLLGDEEDDDDDEAEHADTEEQIARFPFPFNSTDSHKGKNKCARRGDERILRKNQETPGSPEKERKEVRRQTEIIIIIVVFNIIMSFFLNNEKNGQERK